MPPAWQPVTTAAMPDVWRRRLAEGHSRAARQMVATELGTEETNVEFRVGMELPDVPLAREWMQWYTSSDPEVFLRDEERVAVMLTPQGNWVDRPALLGEVLCCLQNHGRPHPVWIGVWARLS